MENRFQHLFLRYFFQFVCSAICAIGSIASADDDLDTEFFEIGLSTGIVTIEDFTSELTKGANITFRATENFFLQFNYLKADVSASDGESTNSLIVFSGSRDFTHYNVLFGYNLFQGEIFRGGYSGLSSLYLVLGAGDTEFLDEASFTIVYGLGYRMALTRRVMLNFDFRQYNYDFFSTDQDDRSVTNSHLNIGFGWLF